MGSDVQLLPAATSVRWPLQPPNRPHRPACPQVVKQVQKNSGIIEQVVVAIARSDLVPEPPCEGDVLDLQEFSEMVESGRVAVVERLVAKYHTISPLLGKVEEVRSGGKR